MAWLIEVTSNLSQSWLHEQCTEGLFSKKTINYDGEDNDDSDDEDDNDDDNVAENDLFIHSFIKKKKSSFLKIFFQFIGAATPAISVWGPVFPLPLRVTTIL